MCIYGLKVHSNKSLVKHIAEVRRIVAEKQSQRHTMTVLVVVATIKRVLQKSFLKKEQEKIDTLLPLRVDIYPLWFIDRHLFLNGITFGLVSQASCCSHYHRQYYLKLNDRAFPSLLDSYLDYFGRSTSLSVGHSSPFDY